MQIVWEVTLCRRLTLARKQECIFVIQWMSTITNTMVQDEEVSEFGRVAALFIVPCDFIKRSIRVCPSINRHKGVALGFRFLYLHDKTYEHVNLRWYSYISFHMIYMYMYICIYICIMWNEITISIMLSLTSPWWPLEHANNLVIQMQILGGGVSLAHGIAVGIFLCRLCQHFEAETNSRYITNDIFECIFMNENIWISHKILLKFVRKCRIDNIPALVRCFRGN